MLVLDVQLRWMISWQLCLCLWVSYLIGGLVDSLACRLGGRDAGLLKLRDGADAIIAAAWG